MAKIANSVPLGGFIAPNDSADTYATHDEQYGRGGFRSVADLTARDAIPADRRKLGMEVKVLADGKKYELIGGTANSNWQEVVTGGEVDPAVITQAVNNAVPPAVNTALSTEVPTLVENALTTSELITSMRLTIQQLKARLPKDVRFKILGDGTEKTDVILKLYLHRGERIGDDTGEDVFLDNNCNTEFSDIRFFAGGDILEHQIISHANCELIVDNKLLAWNCIHDGKIYSTDISEETGLYVSEDNGRTWTLLGEGLKFVGINSLGYIFARSGIVLKRSTDNGVTWESVLTMVTGSKILQEGFAEDSTGVLYAGQYQSIEHAIMYRSIDNGATWTVAWEDANRQHFHGVAVDPYTDWVYAGIDDGTLAEIAMIRSKDHGATWEVIHEGRWGAFISMYATPDTRFFAGGAQPPCIGNTIYKTTDDINFTPVVNTSSSVQAAQVLGNHVYFFCTTYPTTVHAHIIQMELDGSNPKIIWTGDYDNNNGFYGRRFVYPAGIPTGETEPQLLVGTQNGDATYTPARLFDGGNHYMATCHVKIPVVPADGLEIEIKRVASDVSTELYTESLAYDDVLIHYTFEEGTGEDTYNKKATIEEPNKYRGKIITPLGDGTGGGWSNNAIRSIGLTYPYKCIGKSYNFNNSDYIDIAATPGDTYFHNLFVNDFTMLMWIASSDLNRHNVLFRKLGDDKGMLFEFRGVNGNLSFTVTDDQTYTVNNSPYGSAVGHPTMVGIRYDSTNLTIEFIANGSISPVKTLGTAIPYNTGTARIGAKQNSSSCFIGDMGEFQFYARKLTNLEIQQLNENRVIPNGENLTIGDV